VKNIKKHTDLMTTMSLINLSNAMPWLIVNKLRQGFVNGGVNVFILSMISWMFTIHIICKYKLYMTMICLITIWVIEQKPWIVGHTHMSKT
jgi:hypothetical protein